MAQNKETYFRNVSENIDLPFSQIWIIKLLKSLYPTEQKFNLEQRYYPASVLLPSPYKSLHGIRGLFTTS